MSSDGEIRHVSDTALWVAAFRAQEGRRPDAAFDDPLAALSGERGRAIARAVPRAEMVRWGVVVRTSAIDRLIHEALQSGVDMVVNLGAGLDARPYRMDLPATLRWIEIDFPNIVEMKNSGLAAQQPACQLQRIGMDLLDCSALGKRLAELATGTKSILAITEGVLSYFSAHQAAALAEELRACAPLRFWIQDFDNAGQRRLPRGWQAKLKAAPFLFKVKDWFAFFERYGWRPHHAITCFEESQRIKRPYPLDFPAGLILRALPKTMSQRILSLSGAVMMQNVAFAGGQR